MTLHGSNKRSGVPGIVALAINGSLRQHALVAAVAQFRTAVGGASTGAVRVAWRVLE